MPISGFAVPVDHRVKIKEIEKRDKYLDLAREIRILWNMRVTVIPVVTGSHGTVSKGLERELEELKIVGRIEIIQSTALLRSAKIPRSVLEIREDLRSDSDSSEKNISERWCEKKKKLARSIMAIMIIIIIIRRRRRRWQRSWRRRRRRNLYINYRNIQLVYRMCTYSITH